VRRCYPCFLDVHAAGDLSSRRPEKRLHLAAKPHQLGKNAERHVLHIAHRSAHWRAYVVFSRLLTFPVLFFWAEKPPAFLPSWSGMFVVNAFVVAWMLVVGFGLGGWASVTNFVKQIDTFGLFAKCHQCPQVHTQRLGRRRRITS
jgi:hypothetical protein